MRTSRRTHLGLQRDDHGPATPVAGDPRNCHEWKEEDSSIYCKGGARHGSGRGVARIARV